MIPEINTEFLLRSPLQTHMGDDYDFFKIFAYAKSKYKDAYLFESLALPRHQDRYYAMGFDPFIVIEVKKNLVTLSGNKENIKLITGIDSENISFEVENPFDYVKKQFPLNHISSTHQGGLIGYFSYESVNYFEPGISLRSHEDFSDFKMGLYLDGLLYDSLTGSTYYYSHFEDRSELFGKTIDISQRCEMSQGLSSVVFEGDSETKEQFIECTKRTIEKIRSGYSFQAEVGFKSFYTIIGDKINVYAKLREVNPSPYMFYLKFDDEEMFGASPEILISCNKRRLLTTPTAGTIARGKNEQDDRILARQLLSDPKEIAEHNMLVDLHRNDLARVCKTGSIKVDDLMYIIKFSHVQHIVSNVVGELDDDYTAYDALATILPGGVVSGAPKIETVKIIDSNEKMPRGPYGGAVGRFSMNGDCDFCLPLRSIFCAGDKCYAQTSAGIVYDSVPEKEYAEVVNKLAAMKKTLSELGACHE